MNPYLPFITNLLILFIICIAFKLERKFLRGYSHTVVYVLSVVTLLFLFLYSYLFPVRYVSTGTPRRYVDYSISQYKQASVFNVYYGLFLNVLNTLIFVAFFIVNFPYRSFKGSNYSR
jgi:hypothetical protein